MTRNNLFEIIFDKNPNFVISECDEKWFGEEIDAKELTEMEARLGFAISHQEEK